MFKRLLADFFHHKTLGNTESWWLLEIIYYRKKPSGCFAKVFRIKSPILSLLLFCIWRNYHAIVRKIRVCWWSTFYTLRGFFVNYVFLYTRKTAHLTCEHLIPLVPNIMTWCTTPEFWIAIKGLFPHSHSDLNNIGKCGSLMKYQEQVKPSAETFWCLIRDNLNRLFLWILWSDSRITQLINASMKQCNNK